MNCDTCQAHVASDDNFCRRCGVVLRPTVENLRLPVKREAAQPPTVWRQAAPAVARGAALIMAGVAAEWLVRSAAKRAVALPFRSRNHATKNRAPATRRIDQPANDTLAVSETVFVRRLILRR